MGGSPSAACISPCTANAGASGATGFSFTLTPLNGAATELWIGVSYNGAASYTISTSPTITLTQGSIYHGANAYLTTYYASSPPAGNITVTVSCTVCYAKGNGILFNIGATLDAAGGNSSPTSSGATSLAASSATLTLTSTDSCATQISAVSTLAGLGINSSYSTPLNFTNYSSGNNVGGAASFAQATTSTNPTWSWTTGANTGVATAIDCFK
jgi:hypothetical protein